MQKYPCCEGKIIDDLKKHPSKTKIVSIIQFSIICLIFLLASSCNTPQAELKSAEEYYNRGLSYFEKEDPDRAIDDFNRAIDLKPDYVEAYFYRGFAYFIKGDLDQAISDYTQAIQLAPDDFEAYNRRGITYRRNGDLDRAILDYTQAIQLNANFFYAYYNRGLAYEAKGDMHTAYQDVKRAYELCGDSSFCETAKEELSSLWFDLSP